MRSVLLWSSACAIAASTFACKKPDAAPAPDAAPTPSASASAAPSNAPPKPIDFTGIKSNTDPNFMTLSIPDKLEFEKTHRPAASPNADDYFKELEKLGAKWTDRKQVAGWTVGARYCFMSDSEKSVSTVICEFDDEKAAKAGAEKSAKLDKVLKGREVIQHKNVFVAVNDLTEGKGGAAEAKAFKDFAKKP